MYTVVKALQEHALNTVNQQPNSFNLRCLEITGKALGTMPVNTYFEFIHDIVRPSYDQLNFAIWCDNKVAALSLGAVEDMGVGEIQITLRVVGALQNPNTPPPRSKECEYLGTMVRVYEEYAKLINARFLSFIVEAVAIEKCLNHFDYDTAFGSIDEDGFYMAVVIKEM